jgi:hypothetical protein
LKEVETINRLQGRDRVAPLGQQHGLAVLGKNLISFLCWLVGILQYETLNARWLHFVSWQFLVINSMPLNKQMMSLKYME